MTQYDNNAQSSKNVLTFVCPQKPISCSCSLNCYSLIIDY